MKHDVIIPTLGRPEALRTLLSALAAQTRPPDRILVVDDTPGDSVERAVIASGTAEYHRNPGTQSSAGSRNHGISLSSADLVTFFDDDVVPAPDHLAHIEDALERHPNVLGAMGFVTGYSRLGAAKSAFAKAFMLNRRTTGEVRLLRNLNTCYPLDLQEPVPCDWLWGCNLTMRRDVLDRVQFDRQFVRYSLKEDIKLSLDARRAFPGCRFLFVPGARVQEQRSDAGRLAPADVARMNVIHRHYILGQHGLRPPLGSLGLMWSDLGSLAVYAASKRQEFPARLRGTLRGWAAVVRHRGALRRGDLAPLNQGYEFAKRTGSPHDGTGRGN